MNQLPTLGTEIIQIKDPTFKLYSALLLTNAAAIHSTSKRTFQYGPHERHVLDIYYPSSTSTTHHLHDTSTVLLYLHGGALVAGSKVLPDTIVPKGLAYANIGHYFAKRYGYAVVIPSYRLMKHGAKFPSGGEDVGLVVEWLERHGEELCGKTGEWDLFALGHSAGAVHLTTWLFGSMFATGRENVVGNEGLRLRGVVLLSPILHLRNMHDYQMNMVRGYWGDQAEENSPLGLLKAVVKNGGVGEILPGVRFLVLKCTFDPEDEVLEPLREFEEVWRSDPEAGELQVEIAAGHNHISPTVSVGTGTDTEEAWASIVGTFVNTARAFLK